MPTLYIKNMVCARCKWVVKKVLQENGIIPLYVALGEVETAENIAPEQLSHLARALAEHGFKLLEDRSSRLVSQAKSAIVEYVQASDGGRRENLSTYLTERLHQEYSYLSNLFSMVEGTTIEQCYISQRIERAKELLVYDELSLNEIAFKLGYSNVAHLSSQFKKVTGLTPTHFKAVGVSKRKGLEEL